MGKDFNITEDLETRSSPTAQLRECSSEDVEEQKRRLSEVRKLSLAFVWGWTSSMLYLKAYRTASLNLTETWTVLAKLSFQGKVDFARVFFADRGDLNSICVCVRAREHVLIMSAPAKRHSLRCKPSNLHYNTFFAVPFLSGAACASWCTDVVLWSLDWSASYWKKTSASVRESHLPSCSFLSCGKILLVCVAVYALDLCASARLSPLF